VVLAASGRPVWTVDPSALPPAFDAVVQDFANVERIAVDSLKCPEPPWPVGLLFIDGDHTADHALRDLQHFLPWLARDAVILWHDWMRPVVEPGVTRSVQAAARG
jgi:hypothetical protein